ncbi:biotin/lipoate A/B protein ligase family protein [Isosphaeraceae bacterium EP7]
MNCRILPHQFGDGPGQMALDEALLDSVGAAPESAVLRTYGWTRPTLSLGYFQPAELADDARWSDLELVRRPTGGGALLHHHEVTYAVVLPSTHRLARRGPELYRAAHAAIACVLSELGAPASRRGEPGSGPQSEPLGTAKPFLCFADRDAEDLVLLGHKLVGSAQRRRVGALLQHGSLLLSRSPFAPELPGLAELASLNAEAVDWHGRITAAIAEALELDPAPGSATPDELRDAERLQREVYRTDRWTRKR